MSPPQLSVFASDGKPLRRDDVNVLTMLLPTGPVEMREIGRSLGLGTRAVTKLADKLERLGYVKRSLSKTDKRVRLLHLTAKGNVVRDRLLVHTPTERPQ